MLTTTILGAAASGDSVHESSTSHRLPMEAQHLFEVLGLPITNSIIMTWIILIGLVIFVKLTTKQITMVPSGAQNFIEACVEGLEQFLGTFLEKKVVQWSFPVLATFFVFILISNLFGLVPGVGSIGFGDGPAEGFFRSVHHVEKALFRPPTADANMTIAMGIIFFVMNMYWAIKYNGFIGLIKHVFGVKGTPPKFLYPIMFLIFIGVGAIEIVSIGIRPIALAARLYGNIYGGESVLTIMLTMVPGGFAAIPFYFLELVVAIVQAAVFLILCIAFTATLCSHSEEH
ncbi:MAG: F0F1 ATP synthase subunit A [Verrucomicrobiota bacterium]